MKILLFSIYDKKAEAFSTPFKQPTVGSAIRAFGDTVEKPDKDGNYSAFHEHPEDYDLVKLGEFDDNTGLYCQDGCPLTVARATDFNKENTNA